MQTFCQILFVKGKGKGAVVRLRGIVTVKRSKKKKTKKTKQKKTKAKKKQKLKKHELSNTKIGSFEDLSIILHT